MRRPAGARRLARALAQDGFALIDGVADADALLAVARSVATVVPHRDSRPDGVTVLAERGVATRDGFAGFGRHELVPHTDRSSVDRPPGLLMMACGQPADQGGECLVADCAAVYADLAANEPDALEALSVPRSAYFGGAAGHLGSVFSTEPDGRITVRLRLDHLARFSPDVDRWRAALRSTIERHLLMVALRAGEGYVLDNRRWLHGRREFSGNRVLYRITGDPLPHLALPSGFLPDRVPSPTITA
jgi:alpha-ketoglutarate-dependent taurine dioxygenase